MTVVAIRRANLDDVQPLSRMLARAFADEPFHDWLFPVAAQRERRARTLFRCELRNMLRDGMVLTTDSRSGASLWGAPNRPEGGWLSQMIVVFTLWRLLGRRTRKVLKALEGVGEMRPSKPHWYLSVLGTEPGLQRQGVASVLMRAGLAACDRDGQGVWLEVANPALTSFYARFGFVELDRVRLAAGPQIVGMWRDPAVMDADGQVS